MEEAGEGVALTESRTGIHGCIRTIAFLVAGLGTLPPFHGINLGTEEGGGAFGRTERSYLFCNDGTLGVVFLRTRNGVTECNIVVLHNKLDRHLQLLCILEGNIKRIGLETDI